MKLAAIFINFLVILPIWTITYVLGYAALDSVILNPKYMLSISGTGSMYPTFPKGTSETLEGLKKEVTARPVMLKYPNGFVFNSVRYGQYAIKRGDIISFVGFDTVAETPRGMLKE